MTDKIQKLCKRLNRFTLEEIALIAELEEAEMEILLQNLIKENLLIKHDNNYIYNDVQKEVKLKKRLPLMFEYHSPETIDMMIKCFCAEIPASKTSLIIKPQENCISNFNLFFRKILYEKQKEELLKKFSKNPQVPRNRMFFDKEFYFYSYNNFIYVSDELLPCSTTKSFSNQEEKEFKILYSFLTRRLNHNTQKYHPNLYIAEQIWRHKKCFETLKRELYEILF